MRAIYLNDTPVGLIAMKIKPQDSTYYLWRMLIDEKNQKSGYGTPAVELAKKEIQLMGGDHISIRIKPGPQGPQGFYQKLNFKLKNSEEEIAEYVLNF